MAQDDAKVADVAIPDPPKKGASWDQWATWVMRLLTIAVAAYAAWKGQEVSAILQPLKDVTIQVSK